MTQWSPRCATCPYKRASSISEPVLVAVEGKEEVLLVKALARHMHLSGVDVWDTAGKAGLTAMLESFQAADGHERLRSLGVIQDADENHRSTFESVRSALKAAGLPVPGAELEPAGEYPRVAVLVIPAGGRRGALEDVCLSSVQDDPAMECVDRYFQCLEDAGISAPSHLAKARTRVFLASRKKPELRLGEAAQEGYWPFDCESFANLRRLLILLTG